MPVKPLQLCLTLCDPMNCSPPGSSVHGFSRQEYWSELPYPSPGDLPDPGIEPRSPALQADALLSEPPGKTLRRREDTIQRGKITETYYIIQIIVIVVIRK